MLFKTLFLVCIFPFITSGLNILGLFPHPGKSHYNVFSGYLKELAKRGHDVTVLSHFEEKDAPTNFKVIPMNGSNLIADVVPFYNFYYFLALTPAILFDFGNENCELMLENKELQNMINNKIKVDVVIVEQFNSDCPLGVAHQFGAPVVAISSHTLMPWHYNRFGISNNPSHVPCHFLGGGTKPTLLQRIGKTIVNTYVNTLYYYLSQRSEQKLLEKYFDNVPPLEELAREIKFQLMSQNFVLTGSRLLPANVIEVGGLNMIPAKPLTDDFKKFVEDSKHGVVLVSFGSNLRASTIPVHIVDAIKNVTEELPQTFIWKWNDNTATYKNKKLYTSKWLPQNDILGHPNTVAFFSHGGMGSVTEAIYHGVPLIIMPVFGDQPSNAAAVEEAGFGVKIDVNDITNDTLLSAFRTVINKSFQENAKQLSKAWHDRPMSPLDTAIFWTEFAAKYPDKTFRTAAADVPLYQYLLLDVVCVLLLGFIVSCYVVLVLWRFIMTNFSRKTKRE